LNHIKIIVDYRIPQLEDSLHADTYIRLLTAEQELDDQGIPSLAYNVAEQRHLYGVGINRLQKLLDVPSIDLVELCRACGIPKMSTAEIRSISRPPSEK